MAHLLRRMGAAALHKGVLSREEAMQLREQFYRDGLEWPYESIVPGLPQRPPGAKQFLARLKEKEAKRSARQAEIAAAMAKMPKFIAEYRAMLKLDWAEVSTLDKLTLTQAQIKEKYIKRRLAKQ